MLAAQSPRLRQGWRRVERGGSLVSEMALIPAMSHGPARLPSHPWSHELAANFRAVHMHKIRR
jgi:hypothetical protein